MASDYGDESGEKMLDSFARFAERHGEWAMRQRASDLHDAFENAKQSARELSCDAAAPWEEPKEWAKLDMSEFQAFEGYEDIKEIVEAKLRAHGVEPTWFADQETGKEYLLFRIKDAREVWNSLEELSWEVEPAAEKAAERSRQQAREKGRLEDERPLEQRAEEAREASRALEAERAPGLERDRAERAIETRVK